MKFAIIAAGEGRRLAEEGVQIPKPLVSINGEPMLGRLVRIFLENGASEIVLIINDRYRSVKKYVEGLDLPVPLHIVEKNTAGSLHSFYAIAPFLQGEPFCLTTVDTVFRERDFSEYIRHFLMSDKDGCMGVTTFIDDEKPLYVQVDDDNLITGFHDTQKCDERYVSGGLYCLNDKALTVLEKCISEGMNRMRDFQRKLVAEGFILEAFPFSQIVDVDHKDDVDKAESFLRESMKVNIIGVSRGNKYSPNLVSNDAAIIQAVSKRLQEKGYTIKIYDEEYFVKEQIKGDFFFSMARDESTISYLQQLEQRGAVVINSGFGIANCIRRSMTEILVASGIPHPHSWIILQGENIPEDVTYPCWLKRGDSSAQIKEDVSFIRNQEEAETLLSHFWKRGITSAVINEHLQGDLVKFYGVQGTDFFFWFYPSITTHTKFGLEAINGIPQGLPFSVRKLKHYADCAAQALNVPIYGGDCVVMENGEVKIFDFNDWPSFSPCKDIAARKIAECIHNKIVNYGSRKENKE